MQSQLVVTCQLLVVCLELSDRQDPKSGPPLSMQVDIHMLTVLYLVCPETPCAVENADAYADALSRCAPDAICFACTPSYMCGVVHAVSPFPCRCQCTFYNYTLPIFFSLFFFPFSLSVELSQLLIRLVSEHLTRSASITWFGVELGPRALHTEWSTGIS